MAANFVSSPSKYKLDRLFLKRFWRCWKVIFPGCLSTTSLLLVLLMGLSLAEQLLMYNTGLIPSRFYEALLDRDKADFTSILISSSPLILGFAVANTAVKYDSRILYVKWRGLLDRRLHSGYFKHRAYYKMNVLQDKLDNM
ncbi:ATP-binding cassette sub-family D member 4-like isoform X2 [Orbicella faveolata]|uniref:ATP-binding cassette sub-family D member 4-like isoform X2 n=1 Tax=Orbicella faveolata TaxID=48498 RepID=UPI0009E539A8|nr:ATP-binding cassette sub-family D member 4-like isoform X2 [Orbicella faveolata]